LRRTQPGIKRPFRIWLYPLPPFVAIAGFTYILIERPHFLREILLAAIVVIAGSVAFTLRERLRRVERA
jgi:hypothetical protein